MGQGWSGTGLESDRVGVGQGWSGTGLEWDSVLVWDWVRGRNGLWKERLRVGQDWSGSELYWDGNWIKLVQGSGGTALEWDMFTV